MAFVKSAILAIIPCLSEDEAALIADTLVSEGLRSADDFKLLEPSDLTMLKPIDARRLLHHWKTSVPSEPCLQTATISTVSPASETNIASPGPSRPIISESVNNSPNWSRQFSVAWNTMPKPLMIALKDGQRPSARLRLDMVRNIVKDIIKIRQRPGKLQVDHIAEKIVSEFPRSFKDVIEGHIIGSGHDSLTKQLIARLENQNRSSSEGKSKRSLRPVLDVERPAKKFITDSYGCVNYEPLDLPDGEDKASLLVRKEAMKQLVCSDTDCDVEQHMLKTYILQRRDVISGMSVLDLNSEWPLLFGEVGMGVNSNELLGINVKTTLTESLHVKAKRILAYMYDQAKKDLRKVTVDIEVAKQQLGNNTADIPGMILLLMTYFNEEADVLMLHMESSATERDAEKLDLPSTPALLVCGDSLLTASRYMLVIDGCVVNDAIKTFISALSMLFASYFCCNIHYPVGAAATLDFIQRCLLGINPDKGSKVQSKKNKKTHTVHPKVLTLITTLANYEWTE